MANEIQASGITGLTVFYRAVQPDGTERTARTSLPEVGATGQYQVTDGAIQAGDFIILEVNSVVGAGGGEYQPTLTELNIYDPPTRAELTTDKDSIITEVNANETKIDALAAGTVSALLIATGFTEGGTWTLAKLTKVWAAFFTGTKRLKTGETDVFEFLDPDDGTTVVLEMTASKTTPYFTFTVNI